VKENPMPGRILVFDPIVTNRIMLKAQLSIEFFDVTLASDFSELQSQVRLNTPDLILVSYQADRASNFECVHWLKDNQTSAHTPVIFLNNADDGAVWDQSHDLLVDDVLQYRASKWLMTSRLNLLIRSKVRLDAITEQRRTISDMGFAEQSIAFPPPPTKRIIVDLSLAAKSFGGHVIRPLAQLLKTDFPNLQLTSAPSKKQSKHSTNIYIIDSETLGTDAALAQMIALRRNGGAAAPNILFVVPKDNETIAQRALEFGASDFVFQTASAQEIASRIRRILWHHNIAHQAEKTISKHLKSALLDPLTGLYNRRYAMQHLNSLIRDRSDSKSTVTAMVLDLDRFKRINDTYGHLTGDAVIRQTAQRLKKNVRSADLVARIGGEEFLIILENATIERVKQIAERLRFEISSKTFLADSGDAISASASIGVSGTKSTWASSEALIESADMALYRAKDDGRDRVNFCGKAA
jgi:two-component system, cell cycle response regulator